ncbi:MAG: S46 family peptidase, partial [Elusimicrobiota bacterium]
PEARNKQRKAEMARIEKESMDKTGLRSDVVELYQGGEYWLYRYQKYMDVRLVMAPEVQAAFYGGDYDNFTYPRHDLDFAFFRVYQDGKPAASKEHFPFKREGAADGELVFVSGHPGKTERLKTLSQLEYSRDLGLPSRLKAYRTRIQALRDFAARGPEAERRAKDRLFGYENGLKALTGYLQGLREPSLMARKTEDEKSLRAQAAMRPALSAEAGAWERIALAQRELSARHKEAAWARVYGPRLYGLAEHLVLMSAELQKPNEKRYEEYRDSALESLRLKLFTPAPFYPDLEEVLLAASLRESLSELGAGHPWVQAALGGKSPEQAASEALRGSRLFEAGTRKQLAEGGFGAVRASSDPLIRLALRLEPHYRQQRKWYEDRIESVEALEGNKLAKVRFAVLGKTSYPDATFTLRLSYGKVAGYEKDTTLVPPWTNFHGLYGRSASFSGKPPFDLPARIREAEKKVDMGVPVNFVTTNDIIGGNSGSPVVDKEGRLVGLIFDGNIESLVLDFLYTEEQGRAIAVHAGGILESLRAVYGMPSLADELEGR